MVIGVFVIHFKEIVVMGSKPDLESFPVMTKSPSKFWWRRVAIWPSGEGHLTEN